MLSQFKTIMCGMKNFPLELIERTWIEAVTDSQLERAMKFFDHALDEVLYGAKITAKVSDNDFRFVTVFKQ